jgi:sec-independent protein translocase protein TatA
MAAEALHEERVMSLSHWLIVAIVVLLLFGRGKISELMGDLAKGIKSFKQGMAEDDEAARPAPSQPVRTIDNQTPEPVAPVEHVETKSS